MAQPHRHLSIAKSAHAGLVDALLSETNLFLFFTDPGRRIVALANGGKSSKQIERSFSTFSDAKSIGLKGEALSSQRTRRSKGPMRGNIEK
jgi:hypothetical protein